jgi:kynurenine 3-monooxygenase
VENFLEMRDRVGSRRFVWKKRLSVLLHALFPRWYLPMYTMVEFTRIGYADALRRAQRQRLVVASIALALLMLLILLVCWPLLRQ